MEKLTAIELFTIQSGINLLRRTTKSSQCVIQACDSITNKIIDALIVMDEHEITVALREIAAGDPMHEMMMEQKIAEFQGLKRFKNFIDKLQSELKTGE